MSPSAAPATQSAAASPRDQSGPSAPPDHAQCLQCHTCHANASLMSPSATPATQSSTPATQMVGGCRRVPCLPRKVPRRHRATNPVQDHAQCLQCHTCHANASLMSPSATPATQMGGGCRRVPRLPRKVPLRHRATNPVQARHQTMPSVSSATPATQMLV